MNKENNRSAAGLRRSAIAERLRLREEWSALKEIDSQPIRPNVLAKKQINANMAKKLPTLKEVKKPPVNVHIGRLNRKSNNDPSNVLCGVVALVDVGSERRALPLRAALAALGATVMPSWSPLITHLIWAQGGCKHTRARGRALACSLVSPLWLEACAASASRLPERSFPAVARLSDLPSPTLRQMLTKADPENITLNLLDSDDKKLPRLRISSETEQDTTDPSLDTSRDTSHDTSKDTSTDMTKDTPDIESRVNTAPRRALPKTSASVSPRPVTKSRRKLFTQKEAEMAGSSDDEDENTTRPKIPKPVSKPTKKQPVPVPCDRRGLARAERMAKRFLASYSGVTNKHTTNTNIFRIVLTGMSRTERREVSAAITSLKGRLQKCVNKRTTHVILGSCQHNQPDIPGVILAMTPGRTTPRTVSALCGAARGCRVLLVQWVTACKDAGKWLPYVGYEVPHLRKISQKARVERSALAKTRSEYAYDVFCGMRVFVTSSAEQRDAAIQLLHLCGAVLQNGGNQDGGQGLTQNRTEVKKTQHAFTQNGEIRYGLVHNSNEYDIKIGVGVGEVRSKWVFDSVAAARMRTTRRYVVSELSSQASQMFEEMAQFCIEDC